MNLPGFSVMSPSQPDLGSRISADLDGYVFSAWPNVDYSKPGTVRSGSAPVDNLPVLQQQLVISGDGPVPSFERDYYHRVHVFPGEIDLGNLIAERQFEIEVWNAYYSAQTLSTLTAENATGLQLTAPINPPTDYQALESRMHTLNAYTYGPPVVEASFTWAFPGESPVLSIIGNRVAVWPFEPNWRSTVLEWLEWLTDVLPAYDGTEQRRMLRANPRRGFDFELIAAGTDRQQLDALLWEWQSRQFVLPVFTDPGRLALGASVDDTSLSVETTGLAYRIGGFAVLHADNLNTEAAQITDVSANSITLADGLRADWPANTRIYPAELARLTDTQPITAYTAGVDELSVQFAIDLNAAVTAVDSVTQYRGYPVLERQPNWRDVVSAEFQRLLGVLDNQTGVVGVDDHLGRPVAMQDYLWTLQGRAAIAELRAWLHARAGRLNGLWVPTWRMDLTLEEPILASQPVMTIARIDAARFNRQQPGRRDMVIRLRDGSRLYRRIIAAVAVDETTEQLILEANMGVDLDPADVVMISWLQFCRLEADRIEFAWHSTEVLECRHMLRGLPDDV